MCIYIYIYVYIYIAGLGGFKEAPGEVTVGLRACPWFVWLCWFTVGQVGHG
jgi:hypothetical protein